MRSPRRGFALVLVAGILSLLLAAGISLVSAAAASRAASCGDVASARGRLCAESGMGYAASRLAFAKEPSGSPAPGAACEDWSASPAYTRGEPSRGGAAGADLDGDGRPSSWTGRLRGGSPFSLRFSLRIGGEGSHGGIPLNAGYLDAADRDGDGLADHADPDCHPYQLGLVHALNNLGVVAGLATRRWDLPSGDFAGGNPGDPILASWLGNDLVEARPAGGYRGWDDVARTLSRPDLAYSPEEIARLRPFLDLGPYDVQGESARSRPTDGAGAPRSVPVPLEAARREVIESLFLYLSGGLQTTGTPPIPGEPAAWATPCTRTGPAGAPRTKRYDQVRFVVYPDEARSLADAIVSLRASAPLSWERIARELVLNAPSHFRKDYLDLVGDRDGDGTPNSPPDFPVAARSWTQTKGTVAYQAIAEDPYPYIYPVACGAAAWRGLGIDRDGDASNGAQLEGGVPFFDMHLTRAAYPIRPFWQWPASNPFVAYYWILDILKPLQGSLAPRGRFLVESAARREGRSVATIEGECRAREHLSFSCQEDFEALEGGAALARIGIAVKDGGLSPAQRKDTRPGPASGADDGLGMVRRPARPHVATLPRWDRRSFASGAAALAAPLYGFSRAYGAVSLAPQEAGLQGAELYWTFTEDLDGAPNLSPPPAGAPFEFWAEPAGSGGPVHRCPPALGAPDDPHMNPIQSRAGGGSFTFPCPGLDGVPGALAQSFSVEAWIGDGGSIVVGGGSIDLSLSRSNPMDPARGGTTIRASSAWPHILQGAYFNATLEDGDFPDGAAGCHHVVMALEQLLRDDGAYQTRIDLFIDGTDTVGGVALHPQLLNPAVLTTGSSALSITGCDEVRVHRRPLRKADAAALFAQGRFVRRGTFTSPLYDLGGPGRLTEARWHGVSPLLSTAAGASIEPFRVQVLGFLDREGKVPAPRGAASVPRGAPADLSVLGEMRSFRYSVRMDCAAAAGPLTDTPVFDSIGFTLQRRGIAPAWTAWQSR